jgi:hypothetical protein
MSDKDDSDRYYMKIVTAVVAMVPLVWISQTQSLPEWLNIAAGLAVFVVFALALVVIARLLWSLRS